MMPVDVPTGPMLSVIILTKNEAANLPKALASLRALAPVVFVVDSGSDDGTLDVARSAGCHVVQRAWTTYAEQLTWAIENLPITTPWVMRLDADERLTPELVQELLLRLPVAPVGVTGFELKRRVYFWGQWIKHGGYYPTWLFRVWRRGTAVCEQRWMDEHMVSSSGRLERLSCDIIDENFKGLTFWVDKHNRYADREVKDLVGISARRVGRAEVRGQAGVRRWLKENVYARAPLFVRPFAYWGFRYFLKLGVLDGVPGLVFHFNQGLWYRLLVDAKLYEMKLRGIDEDKTAAGANAGDVGTS